MCNLPDRLGNETTTSWKLGRIDTSRSRAHRALGAEGSFGAGEAVGSGTSVLLTGSATLPGWFTVTAGSKRFLDSS